MKCLYKEQRSWVPPMADDVLESTHKIQHEHHRHHDWVHYAGDGWHGQATYNLAVRQELRKRGLPVRRS